MSTKKLVLEILEKNRNKNISGEYIGQQLNLSRNSVWRSINTLRKEGYRIEGATNKGYKLMAENDIISLEGISPFLANQNSSDIWVYKTIESTNKEAKLMAINNAPHGRVIISDEQTMGKGRFGRDFFSPSNSGIYMSFILRPDNMNVNPTAITAYAAVKVCQVIENLCNLKPSIKWVNDIFLRGKKICGILTEAITDCESNSVSAIILGIGINVFTKKEEFPEEIKEKSSSLYLDGTMAITRNQIIGEIINSILGEDIPQQAFIFEEYKKRLFILNQDITVIQGKNEFIAKALDVNKHGHLVVQIPEGEIKEILSGEIRIF
ncbi:MAG: biotin--[acetyl-CoA-carboxylase] ligase [Lachnospirales bacterium]